MKNIISLLIAISLFLPSVVYADQVVIPAVQKPDDEIDIGNAISPMKKGQKAPFTGVLLSPGATATIITDISTIDEKIKIEVDKSLKICTAQCDFEKSEIKTQFEADKKVLMASIEEKTKRLQIMDSEIKRLESEKVNPYLWSGLGFAGGTIATILTIFAINQTTK